MTSWAISTPHALATDAGAAALAGGGNAIDAALAAAAVLTVVLPEHCGVGGDLIALVRQPDGRSTVVNASGPAAGATSADDLRNRFGLQMPSNGPETVTVPGAVAGWEALATRWAQRPWAELLQPAIAHAREGLPVARSTAFALRAEGERLAADPGMRSIFYPAGEALSAGDRVEQPQLARSLERIAAVGASAFYAGELGERWLATLGRNGSHLAAADLAAFAPEIAQPVRARRNGLDILTAAPNSQGVTLPLILGSIERDESLLSPLSNEAAELTSAFRETAALRDRLLADPRMSRAPQELIARVANRATGSAKDTAAGRPPTQTRGDTVAIVAADADGRAISLIQSLFDWFGAGILDPATGITAHNRGSGFSLDPTSPNVIAPGKRPAHTLMPVMAEASGALRFVLGTMGGPGQAQILSHLVLHLQRGLSCADAVAAPRWVVHGNDGHSLKADAHLPSDVESALIDAGWRVGTGQWETGESQLIACHADAYDAASDPRGDGAARISQHRDRA